jgi:hypothetical protein
MTILNHSALVESKTIRSGVLCDRTDEQAIEALNKAKAIVLAVWQGEGYATTEQVAEYYCVDVEAIKWHLRTNREEFAKEVKTLEGEDINLARKSHSLSSKARKVNFWTSRGMLRVGLMLTDSPIARNVRDVVLNLVESAPAIAVLKAEIKKTWGGKYNAVCV